MTVPTRARQPAARPIGANIVRVALALVVAYGLLAAGAGYWMIVRGTELASSPDNPAVIAAARNAPRGRILAADGTVLARNRRAKSGEPYRVYPEPAFAPLVGYASPRYGTAGLERAYSSTLLGLPETNAVDALIAKFRASPLDPADITLAVSADLQKRAVRLLGERRGAVVMLDPRTGEVLAMASTPVYDASDVSNPATADEAFAALRDDPASPLLLRPTLGTYVPGSTFKIVTAAAGLESAAITPSTTYRRQPAAEEDGLLVEGFRIRDGHHPQTGSRRLDLYGATEVSCNIWFALTGLETGGEALVKEARRFGIGESIPFDLPTARSQVNGGAGPAPGGFVDDVELAAASFGQGEVLVTPLQMALVAAAVANDGEIMRPQLVRSIESERGGERTVEPTVWRRAMSEETAATLTRAMVGAVNGELGRLFTTGARVPGVEVAGKSGTAELGGSGEPHSWFMGFAPAENPTVAIAIVVERGGRGGELAAPMAGDLLERYFAATR